MLESLTHKRQDVAADYIFQKDVLIKDGSVLLEDFIAFSNQLAFVFRKNYRQGLKFMLVQDKGLESEKIVALGIGTMSSEKEAFITGEGINNGLEGVANLEFKASPIEGPDFSYAVVQWKNGSKVIHFEAWSGRTKWGDDRLKRKFERKMFNKRKLPILDKYSIISVNRN